MKYNIYLETIVIALGVLFFFFMVGFLFSTYLFKQNVKKDFDTFLSTNDLKVYVDNSLLNKAETNSLVESVKYMYNAGGNRPTDKYWNVTFMSGTEEYNIKLVRAQSDSLLYYLYINGYESLASNEIGTIRTEVLSKYQKKEVKE